MQEGCHGTRDGHGMSKDAYAVSAPVYDLLNASFRPGQVAALERLIPLVRAESGPVLDIGARSGLNTVFVLERLPEARVYALEPSTAMRALTPRGRGRPTPRNRDRSRWRGPRPRQR